MDRDAIRAEWIRRLRSGEYQQGRGYLKREEAIGKTLYCCLGVLCEIFVENGEIKSTRDRAGWYLFGSYYFQAVPEIVQEKVGLCNGSGSSRYGIEYGRELSELNDRGHSFHEIATELETGDFWDDA